MALAQAPGKVKHSYQIDKPKFDKFTKRAEALGISPSALVRLLIDGLLSGDMKLPRPDAFKDTYQ